MGRVILALIALTVFSGQAAQAKVVDERVYIIPAGDVDRKVLKAIKEELPAKLPMDAKIVIEDPKALPDAAYDASRRQYDADAALKALSRRVVLIPSMECALFITGEDLYVKDLNFVYGLANPPKVSSIVSLARLKNEFYGLKSDHPLLVSRAVKESIHELGHGWGLGHCADKKCVMCFSDTIQDTDKKRAEFCHACRRGLQSRYGAPLADVIGKNKDRKK
jgi:archaemetzincin